jgi:hypothetical protein
LGSDGSGCGINRFAIYSSPDSLNKGAPTRVPGRAISSSPKVEDKAGEFEGNTSFLPHELKAFFDRFLNPAVWRKRRSEILRRCNISAKNMPLKEIEKNHKIELSKRREK